MNASSMVFQKVFSSGALGEGARVATATAVSTLTGGAGPAVVTMSVTAPVSMSGAELEDFATFVGSLAAEVEDLQALTEGNIGLVSTEA